MCDTILLGEVVLPAMPAALGLALVAALGYFVGRNSRQRLAETQQTRKHLEQALDNTQQLEKLTDDVLLATRNALNECRLLTFGPRANAESQAAARPLATNGLREPALTAGGNSRER